MFLFELFIDAGIDCDWGIPIIMLLFIMLLFIMLLLLGCIGWDIIIPLFDMIGVFPPIMGVFPPIMAAFPPIIGGLLPIIAVVFPMVMEEELLDIENKSPPPIMRLALDCWLELAEVWKKTSEYNAKTDTDSFAGKYKNEWINKVSMYRFLFQLSKTILQQMIKVWIFYWKILQQSSRALL